VPVLATSRSDPEKSGTPSISYEELADDPDKTLAKITEFTGSKRFHESVNGMLFEVHRRSDIIENMNATSIGNLKPPQISAINVVAGDYLKKYGYFRSKP
jgi:hypothetical protein